MRSMLEGACGVELRPSSPRPCAGVHQSAHPEPKASRPTLSDRWIPEQVRDDGGTMSHKSGGEPLVAVRIV